MKTGYLKHLFKSNPKQWQLLIISGFLWLLFTNFQLTLNQYAQDEARFYNNVKEFISKQEIEIKRSDTLLHALSEYYSAQTLKSNLDFRHFASGLVKNNQGDMIIGLASLINRSQKAEFENQQQRLGYESFRVDDDFIFNQQQENKKYAYLPVVAVTPMNPKNSSLLAQDLFTIPKLVKKFAASLKSNSTQRILLAEKQSGNVVQISILPTYVNNNYLTSHEQRLKAVRGIVFTIEPLEQVLSKIARELFTERDLSLILRQSEDIRTTKHYFIDEDKSHHHAIDHIFNWEFIAKIPTMSNAESQSLEIRETWHLERLQTWDLLKYNLIALIIYLLIATLLIAFYRYTYHLQEIENRLKQIFATSQDAVIITDEKGHIEEWNPQAEKTFDIKREDAIGDSIVNLIMGSAKDNDLSRYSESGRIELFQRTFDLDLDNPQSQTNEVLLFNAHGKQITAEVASSILQINNNTEISLFVKDITHQRKTEEAMTQMAFYDPLTGLENRSFFKKSVTEVLKNNPYHQVSILFMDLDGFKKVNDTLGHSVGDELLKVIAKRIQTTIRDSRDKVHICRFGGDEFIIMLENVNANGAANVSKRLLNKVERTIKIAEDEMDVSGSIGIACYPDHGSDVDTLLRHADTAMYQSKAMGKNTYSLYNENMEAQLEEKLLIEKHLRNAIENDELEVYYQPQVSLSSGHINGVEALLRWHNPTLGFVPPDKFISIAEDSQLILKLGEWVAQTCIEQLQIWQQTHLANLHIAMNVSSVQFEDPDFIDQISNMMKQANLPNHLLEIELTERTVMSNVSDNIVRFNQIRSSGYGLSVDDFGTGYSSLSYLKRFPLSILKIDKSFVDGIPKDDDDKSIATAILNLAHSLNMHVVAEGVETIEQLLFLRELNCDFAQGYFISRPLPIYELEEWLQLNKGNFYYRHNDLKQLIDAESLRYENL
ncbi:EAL domain-containing protein [Thiomicrorhabdus sediminis]|uniref:cyclic-guanylate-specific phosphodiesterase n=1 Tax=Thiomicrorhabdus sediminis TaxID=2580412 RepID=A0A4P9K981_9GAMM|nr:EAL domain-containing protein [Thiomicrorhabdus sediminis]QCU90877.1 EAL domain-containing protein [Thiomicrorhabdus sediminis]